MLKPVKYSFALAVASIGIAASGHDVNSKICKNGDNLKDEYVSGEIESHPQYQIIEKDPDGFFYLNLCINGIIVRLLIDTGASVTILSPADAARSGVIRKNGSRVGRMRTASGYINITNVSIAKITIAGRNFTSVRAIIIQDGINISLLGQNLLRLLPSVMIEGDQVTVTIEDGK